MTCVVCAACVAWQAPGVARAEGDEAAAPATPPRRVWEYALFGTAIAGVATGVTLVTVNHARVKDYNLGVQAYNQGVNANPDTFRQLADLRESINTGERWGYIVGAVGVCAGLVAGYLYVTDEGSTGPSASVAAGWGSLSVYGRF